MVNEFLVITISIGVFANVSNNVVKNIPNLFYHIEIPMTILSNA